MRQPAAETAREVLDEVRESLRYRDSWVSRDRETELKLRLAGELTRLALLELEVARDARAATWPGPTAFLGTGLPT